MGRVFFLPAMILGMLPAILPRGASAQISATIDIDSSRSTPLNANFSGFNDEVAFPAEYFDYRLNNLAAQLSPGWVRYPSGSYSEAFDWQTGLMVPGWVEQFQGTMTGNLVSQGLPLVNGKGGGSFVDGANRADFLNAKLIVCVNAFTDTPQSAGRMAAFAKANHIPVAVWELDNEPYFYNTFYSSGADYVAKMKPFRDAIKAADPNAIVAIFFIDAGNTAVKPIWDQSIASYPDKYWDAVTYHHYGLPSNGPFSQWMADENATLASKTTAYVTNHLVPLNPVGMKFLISEFLPTSDGMGTGTSATDGTLYGAIYAAEYVMRMSGLPSMLYVGQHALTGTRGVNATNPHYIDVQNAYNHDTTIDTLSLPFGYYTVVQPLGLAVLNGVLRDSTQVESTTVTGGDTVPATGLGTIPALYAQSYLTPSGRHSLIISNKSATTHIVTVHLNGTTVPGSLPVQYISGADPSVTNTAANPSAVSITSDTAPNPVTVPPYSVIRIDLTAPNRVIPVNAASYASGTVAPQEIVSIFAPGIATQTAAAGSLPLPTSLAGTAIQITDSAGNSQLAPLFAVTPGQANFLLPQTLAAGAAKITVLHGAVAALSGSVNIGASAPGIFTANADGAGVAAVNPFRVTASNENIPENAFACTPSIPRSCLPSTLSLGGATDTLYVELYGTGIRGAASVQCFVAGQNIPVLYAGPSSSAGLDQVNISIPRTLAGSGNVRVYLVADGVFSNVAVLSF